MLKQRGWRRGSAPSSATTPQEGREQGRASRGKEKQARPATATGAAGGAWLRSEGRVPRAARRALARRVATPSSRGCRRAPWRSQRRSVAAAAAAAMGAAPFRHGRTAGHGPTAPPPRCAARAAAPPPRARAPLGEAAEPRLPPRCATRAAARHRYPARRCRRRAATLSCRTAPRPPAAGSAELPRRRAVAPSPCARTPHDDAAEPRLPPRCSRARPDADVLSKDSQTAAGHEKTVGENDVAMTHT
jgi:hypothetical protein